MFREWLVKIFQEDLISFFSWFEYLAQQCLWASSRGRPASNLTLLKSSIRDVIGSLNENPHFWETPLSLVFQVECVQFFRKINWFFFFLFIYLFVVVFYIIQVVLKSSQPDQERSKKKLYLMHDHLVRCWDKNFSASLHKFFLVYLANPCT